MRTDRERARGFTLVEVLLAAAIAALLSAALVHVLYGVLDLSEAARGADTACRDARLAVSFLERDVRDAERILQIGAGTLVLLTAAGDTVSYAWDPAAGDTLRRSAGGGPAVLAAAVDSLTLSLHTVSRPYTLETLQTILVPRPVESFSPGDWDQWIADTYCDYESREDKRVKDKEWRAEEFWTDEKLVAFTRAAVRAAAKEVKPPPVDLLVCIYKANGSAPYYPGLLVAQGRIDRMSLGTSYAWREAALTMLSADTIPAGGRFWVVLRPDGSGTSSYAGHIEVERVKNCYIGQWPGTAFHYRESTTGGTTWSDRTDQKDAFFAVDGLRADRKLAEMTATLADTLGVSYFLRLASPEGPERRAGFIARYDP